MPKTKADVSPRLADWSRQLANLNAIVAAARALTRQISFSFPVEDKTWVFASDPGGCGPAVNVINAARWLDKLLYPLGLPFNATSYDYVLLLNGGVWPERLGAAIAEDLKSRRFRGGDSATSYAFASFTGSPDGAINHVKNSLKNSVAAPSAAHEAVRAVMVAHDQLLRHYGWGSQVAGDSSAPSPWEWPEVPLVPQMYLDCLEIAATRLAEVVGWCEKVAKPLPSVNANDETRDRWLYEQRCAGTPDKEILAALRKRCTSGKKRWRLIGSVQGVRDRAADYARRHGKPAPPARRGQ